MAEKNGPVVEEPENPTTKASLEDTVDELMKVSWETVKRDFLEDLRAHDFNVFDYDGYEAMVMSRTYDSISRETSNGMTDGATTTLYLERSARVVGQLPEGQIKAYGKKDSGKAALMDIIRQKWIYPNANAQAPLLNKLRMWQFYSSVYGWMPMYYDWHVDEKTGYIGPNCWLWSPRNFLPQNGYTYLDDMDYVHTIAWVSPSYIQSIINDPNAEADGWNVEALLQVLASDRNKARFPDTKRDTFIRRQRTSQASRNLIGLATRYEAGPDGYWRTFAWEYGFKMLREIPNPHKSAKIPFVVKYCIPLFDSFYGLGDFQRARPLQFAKDGLTNFYFEGIRQGIYPPTIVNPSGVVRHTMDLTAGSVWEEIVPNSIRRLEPSSAGLNTYRDAMTQLNGSLLNQAGTTDTVANAQNSLDPAFGKTPQAIQMNQQRESTRDNQDRFYLEQSVEELINRMLDLIPVMGTETIPIDLWSDEAQLIATSGYPDIMEMLDISQSGQSARLNIKPGALKGISYRFHLDASSTAKADKNAQLQSLITFTELLARSSNQLTQLNTMGKTVDWDVLFTTIGQLSDIPNMEQIIRKMTQEEQQAWQSQNSDQHDPRELINYKDAPPSIQAQMEQAAGMQPDPSHSQGMAHPAVGTALTPMMPVQPRFMDDKIKQAATTLLRK